MTEKLDKHILNNSMVVLGEPMEQVESVAFVFRLPAGAARLGEGCCGAGAVITDWIFRGAGKRSSKELIDALDGLGLHRNSSVISSHISLGAALEASNLSSALDLYADIILRPGLEPEQFELSKKLAVHELTGLDDDPRQKVILELYEQFYPYPLGLPAMGKLDELEKLSVEKTTRIIKEKFNLSQTIFSVAGKYDFDAVCRQIEDLFEVEQPEPDLKQSLGKKGAGYTHHQHDGAQVHISLMTETVPIGNEDYYNALIAVSVLSGGMSSRLFTEVREKRGLCYAVGAQYHTLKGHAGIGCYAGTTPDKAQETVDVIKAEFDRLSEGITEDEIHRAKVGLKSTLIMQSESSSSRASGIASDYYLLDRVRNIEEIKEAIEGTSVESVESFLKDNKFKDFTFVTIGPKEVKK